MPRNYIYETAITIDYDDGIMLVDTTLERDATRLVECGFVEITKKDSHPYRRFKGDADQLRFRQPKWQRKLRGAVKARVEALPDSILAA